MLWIILIVLVVTAIVLIATARPKGAHSTGGDGGWYAGDSYDGDSDWGFGFGDWFGGDGDGGGGDGD